MNKRNVGDEYEKLAAIYLTAEGFQILEHNFRCRIGEIDIIATKDGYLRFIEVKYRSNGRTGSPQEAVNYKKQRQISKVASYYLMKKGYSLDTACCFDVIGIWNHEIMLLENAFEYCN